MLAQPGLLEGRLVLGMALTAQGRHDEVLQEMRVALESDPQSALGWLMKGEALIGKGDFAQAESVIERAQSLDPSNPKASQLLESIDRARAAGVEDMPIESTGTKEYPARAVANVKWRPSSSVSFGPNEGSTGGGEVASGETTGELDGAARSGALTAVGRRAREPQVDESTSVDPEPARSLAAEILPVTLLAPSLSEAAPTKPGVAVAGPEEATMLGGPRGIVSPRPADGAAGRSTRELGAFDDGSLDDAGFGQLPSGAQTLLAPRDDSAKNDRPVRRASPTREDAPPFEDRSPLEDGPMFDDAEDFTGQSTRLAQKLSPTEDRITKEVEKVDPDPLGYPSAADPVSDASISLSVAEVVFDPTGMRRLEDSVIPLEDPSFVDPSLLAVAETALAPEDSSGPGAGTDDVEQRARRWRERAGAAQQAQPVRYDPPVQFVAPVPLNGMISQLVPVPAESDLHPRIDAPVDADARGRKPAHLAHAAVQRSEPRPEPAPSQRPASREPARPGPREPKARSPRRRHAPGLWSRVADALQLAPASGSRDWLTFGAVVVGLMSVAVIAGLLIREWRLRARVEHCYELAQNKLISGNYSGYQAAELLYRQILAERDDRRAAALRAKVLSQLSFEFGESPEPAQRAVAALSSGNLPEEREARIYLSLAKGELEVAARQAAALVKDRPGAPARYLLGQAELLLDQPDQAATALRTAAAEDPQNPIVLHALGVAEAALKRDDAAFVAYGNALHANANHVATIIDRALLQLRQGLDREAAAGSLEGVVGKLVGDASPGQLARAYVGLAEIELAKGNVTAARSALSSAAARRRDHPLLLEELAKAYADAFELDPAEREARRALAVSGRLTPRLILAEVALRRSRPVQALTILDESASARPEALVLRALAKLDLGRTAEARDDAELATRLDPSSISAAVALARVDIGETKYDAAKQRLEALEKQGQYAEVAWALGQVYMARRMPDRARLCFRAALHRQPLLLQARLALAILLHDAGQLSEAREEVNRILATNAAYLPARRELAWLALDLGDAVAARDEFDALAERDADVDTLLGGARARLLLADARGAEDRIERALKLKPTGADLEAAQCLKARALLADHRASEVIILLREIVPSAAHGEPLALFIEAYLDYGRTDWAEKAIGGAPVATRTGVEFTLAKAHLAIEEVRQAAGKALAEEALQRLKAGRSPVWLRAQAYALLGRAELELSNARGAVRALKSALDLDPRNVRALHTLGLAELDLKRPEDAAGAFEGAIANDPRYADSQYFLGRTRRELADPRADDALRAYLELQPRGALADDARQLLQGGPVTPLDDGRARRPLR